MGYLSHSVMKRNIDASHFVKSPNSKCKIASYNAITPRDIFLLYSGGVKGGPDRYKLVMNMAQISQDNISRSMDLARHQIFVPCSHLAKYYTVKEF